MYHGQPCYSLQVLHKSHSYMLYYSPETYQQPNNKTKDSDGQVKVRFTKDLVSRTHKMHNDLSRGRRDLEVARLQRNLGDSSQSLSLLALILPPFTNSSSFWVQHERG